MEEGWQPNYERLKGKVQINEKNRLNDPGYWLSLPSWERKLILVIVGIPGALFGRWVISLFN